MAFIKPVCGLHETRHKWVDDLDFEEDPETLRDYIDDNISRMCRNYVIVGAISGLLLGVALLI